MSVNRSTETFIQLVRSGKLSAEDIDQFVAAWRQSEDRRELSEALGFSMEEYALWVEQPASLDRIIRFHCVKPLRTEPPSYFGILRKYVKKGTRPWTRENDGDATHAAWARDETV